MNEYTKDQLRESHDLDLQVRELHIRAGRKILAPNGVTMPIIEVVPHLDKLILSYNDQHRTCSLRQLVYNLLAGKGQIID